MFIFVLLIIAISAFIQGVTSFGFSLIALPLLALLMPMNQIVPLLVVCSLFLNAVMLWSLHRHVVIRLIRVLLVGGVVGIPIGIWILSRISGDILKLAAGVVIILVSVVLLSGNRWQLKEPKVFYFPLGLFSGIMQGSLSLSGPPLVLFLSNQGVDKQTFRANLTAFFTAMNLLSLPGFIISGVMDQSALSVSVYALPGMIIGVVMGNMVASKMPEDLFRKGSLALMCLAGVMAVVTSVF